MSPRWTLLLSLAVVTAGCFGFGGSGSSEPAYKGRYEIVDLYLFPLGSAGGQDNRWELYPGAKVEAWGFSLENDITTATVPGPTIRVRQGDTVEVNFIINSATPMAHTIHWHGIHVPWDQDGVPYVSQAPLGHPFGGGNGTFTHTYVFKVDQPGTYWYHCHVDTQHHLDMGMYGAFIVDPADPSEDPPYDHEAILILDEWDKSHIHSSLQPDQMFSRSGDPEYTVDALYSQLRDYYNQNALVRPEELYHQAVNDPLLPDAFKDIVRENPPPGVREQREWYPITYPPYYANYDTFLINGHAFPMTEPILVETGNTLRMRFINAGSYGHAMHLHGHHMLVTHTDGFPLPNPYWKDTLFIAPGERYDVYVYLENPGPWMLHDHMPQFEQNDDIHPGGMMTHLCYRDGWEFASLCDERHLHDGESMTSGHVVEGLARLHGVTQNAYIDPAYRGMQVTASPGHGH